MCARAIGLFIIRLNHMVVLKTALFKKRVAPRVNSSHSGVCECAICFVTSIKLTVSFFSDTTHQRKKSNWSYKRPVKRLCHRKSWIRKRFNSLAGSKIKEKKGLNEPLNQSHLKAQANCKLTSAQSLSNCRTNWASITKISQGEQYLRFSMARLLFRMEPRPNRFGPQSLRSRVRFFFLWCVAP